MYCCDLKGTVPTRFGDWIDSASQQDEIAGDGRAPVENHQQKMETKIRVGSMPAKNPVVCVARTPDRA